MITVGEAAILLETTQRAFRNQSQSKQRSTLVKIWSLHWGNAMSSISIDLANCNVWMQSFVTRWKQDESAVHISQNGIYLTYCSRSSISNDKRPQSDGHFGWVIEWPSKSWIKNSVKPHGVQHIPRHFKEWIFRETCFTRNRGKKKSALKFPEFWIRKNTWIFEKNHANVGNHSMYFYNKYAKIVVTDGNSGIFDIENHSGG